MSLRSQEGNSHSVEVLLWDPMSISRDFLLLLSRSPSFSHARNSWFSVTTLRKQLDALASRMKSLMLFMIILLPYLYENSLKPDIIRCWSY